MEQKFCPVCKLPIFDNYIFCPNCGSNIKAESSPTVGKQISVYLISFFLPPLGLFPAIRYLRRNDPKAKKVAWIAIGLTVVSTIISIWLFVGAINSANKALNQQLNIEQFNY